MQRGEWAEQSALYEISLNGVIASARLERLGASTDTIARRCRPGGPWQRLLPGVVLLHNGPPTNLERLSAAAVYGGPAAMFSGHAALGLHGYASSSSMNDVLLIVPAQRHRKPVSYVKVERTHRMPDPVIRGSFACAPVARAAIDTARGMRRIDRIEALLAQAIQRGDVTLEDLVIELAEGQRRYSALPRKALELLATNAHSVPEVEAQQLYKRTGLPPMVFNQDVYSAAGEFVARPDGWIDEIGLAWEIDSLAHHFSVADHRHTVERRAKLKRYGAVVVESLSNQLRSARATVVADLRAGHRAALARPRPSLFLLPPGCRMNVTSLR